MPKRASYSPDCHKHGPRGLLVLTLASSMCGAMGCEQGLPENLKGYRERCLLMTNAPIPPTSDDPHDGIKRVYACNVQPSDLLDAQGQPRFPYPEGVLIVKESRKPEQDHIWLIATAEKRPGGDWSWREYTRNFSNEKFAEILSPQSVCTGCHEDARGTDWIFTVYGGP